MLIAIAIAEEILGLPRITSKSDFRNQASEITILKYNLKRSLLSTCFVNLSPTKVGQWHHDEAESPEDGEQHRALGGLRHVANIPVPAMQCIFCTAVPVICL